ncbi:phytochrome-like protein cph1 [bacterium BMS3Abin05]|nr:phytochrome-like protein cph1 [bacterium BMS3Abin05]GBE27044.1 phytochrome-like protein cph1 [bacterium BMS3Bbin03]HDL77958.1 PAS domain S-box protein [Bacteroidota bacterium]HDZ13101.1 PAS domain S-box protein [Bacteroidota bacterium]
MDSQTIAAIVIKHDFRGRVRPYFREVLETIQQITHASACCLEWFTDELDALTMVVGENTDVIGQAARFPEMANLLKSQKPVFVQNAAKQADFSVDVRNQLSARGISAFAGLPILVDGVQKGKVVIVFSKPVSGFEKTVKMTVSPIRLIEKFTKDLLSADAWDKTRELIQRLQKNSADGIFLTDKNGIVVYASAALEKKIHRKTSTVIGRPISVIGGPNAKIFRKKFNTLQEGSFRKELVQFISKRGKENYLEVKVLPVNLSSGDAYVLWLVKDVTKRIKEAKSLENWRKNIEEFTYTVSHDLKAPIISIEGYLSLLLSENLEELSGDGKYYIHKISKNVRLMKQMIQELLELSRIGQDKGEFRQISFSPIIRNVLDEYRFQIEKRGVEVVVPNRFPRLKCNPQLIQLLFSNLVSNAIKFLGDQENPRIEIGWKRSDSSVVLFVKDNGIGISPKNHDWIFNVFYRLERTQDVEGSGVGLAIVKKIIESHNGQINVDSDLGQGTTFFLSFPKGN